MTPNMLNSRWTRTRVLMLAGVVVAVVAGGIWASTRSGRTQGTKKDGAVPMANMPGMEGMAGMSAGANGTVRLTADQIRQFGITFGIAEVRPLTAETRTTGVVTADETRTVQVTPKIGGFVERLHVNATGQSVRRGQPLLELYSSDLVAAQQELLVAGQLQRDMGRSAVPGVSGSSADLVAASRRRLQLWDISDSQIDEILRTRRVRRTLTLFAPVSGVVTVKLVQQGQAIMAGQELYTIVDLSSVWVDVQLREGDAGSVRVGTGADIEVAGLSREALKGRVEFIYPTLDSASRSVRARVVVANSAGVLKPGMYATVRLTTPSRSALTVPSSAVLRGGDRDVVFMDMGNGKLMPMEVTLGRTAGDLSEIVSGLEAGTRVVTSAQFLLDSESNLGEVMKSMLGQTGTGTMAPMADMPGMVMPGAAPATPAAPRR